jgi:hypothetical protein
VSPWRPLTPEELEAFEQARARGTQEAAEPPRRMLRWEVPVDDRPHKVRALFPRHVESRHADVVEFWSDQSGPRYPEISYQVFGTGQPLPPSATWIGTCIPHDRPDLVWHLYEVGSEL